MSELGFYLAGTLLRGGVLVLLLLAAERLFRINFARPNTRKLWILLLALLVIPVGIFSLPLPRHDEPQQQPAPAVRATPYVASNDIATPATLPAIPQQPELPKEKPSFRFQIPTTESLAGFLSAVYIGVTLVLLLIRLVRMLRWNRKLAGCVPVNDARLLRLFSEACQITGISPDRAPLLDGNGCLDGPGCCGFRHCSILFPVRDAEMWSDQEIRMLLVHELGHLRHGDSRWSFCFHFVDAFYWFNPVYRILRGRLTRSWEIDCDANVVQKLELNADERCRYARLIFEFHLRVSGMAPLPCPGLSGNAQELKQRITELTMNKPFRHRKLILGATLVLAAAAGSFTPVFAEPRQEKSAVLIPELETQDWNHFLSNTIELVKEKKYAQANDRYRWFFNHILEHRQSMAGVRLSFAIMHWKQLGEKYPPALEELQKMRRERAAAFEGPTLPPDSMEKFAELNALDWAFDEEEKTLELFRRLDAEHPKFARECWHYVLDFAIQSNELELLQKYAPDLEEPVRQLDDTVRHTLATSRFSDNTRIITL